VTQFLRRSLSSSQSD